MCVRACVWVCVFTGRDVTYLEWNPASDPVRTGKYSSTTCGLIGNSWNEQDRHMDGWMIHRGGVGVFCACSCLLREVVLKINSVFIMGSQLEGLIIRPSCGCLSPSVIYSSAHKYNVVVHRPELFHSKRAWIQCTRLRQRYQPDSKHMLHSHTCSHSPPVSRSRTKGKSKSVTE